MSATKMDEKRALEVLGQCVFFGRPDDASAYPPDAGEALDLAVAALEMVAYGCDREGKPLFPGLTNTLHPSTVSWLDQSIAEVSEFSDHNPADTAAARAVIHLRRLRDFVREQGVPPSTPAPQPSGYAFYC